MQINIKNFASIIDLSEKLKVQASKRKPRIFSVGKLEKEIKSKTKSKMKLEPQYNANRKSSKQELKNIPKLEPRTSSKSKNKEQAKAVSHSSKVDSHLST